MFPITLLSPISATQLAMATAKIARLRLRGSWRLLVSDWRLLVFAWRLLAWVLGLDRLKNARLWLGIIEGNRSWVLHGFWIFVLISKLKGRNPNGCLWLGNGFGYGSLLVIRQWVWQWQWVYISVVVCGSVGMEILLKFLGLWWWLLILWVVVVVVVVVMVGFWWLGWVLVWGGCWLWWVARGCGENSWLLAVGLMERGKS